MMTPIERRLTKDVKTLRDALRRIENDLARRFGEKYIATARKGASELALHLAGVAREALNKTARK